MAQVAKENKMSALMSAITAKASLILLTLLTCILMAVSAIAQSQATAADLTGTVTDPSGAVVPGATVTAHNAATGISRTVTADSQGAYQLIALPPGDYDISAEA